MHDFLLVFEFEWSKVRYILNQIQGNFFLIFQREVVVLLL